MRQQFVASINGQPLQPIDHVVYDRRVEMDNQTANLPNHLIDTEHDHLQDKLYDAGWALLDLMIDLDQQADREAILAQIVRWLGTGQQGKINPTVVAEIINRGPAG